MKAPSDPWPSATLSILHATKGWKFASEADAGCIGSVVIRVFRGSAALFKIVIHFFDVVHHFGGAFFFAKHFAEQLEVVVVLVIEHGFGLVEADEGNAGLLL